jgi:hypothetical protein
VEPEPRRHAVAGGEGRHGIQSIDRSAPARPNTIAPSQAAFIFDAGEACSAYIYTRGRSTSSMGRPVHRQHCRRGSWLPVGCCRPPQGVWGWWGELTPAATAVDGEIKLVA